MAKDIKTYRSKLTKKSYKKFSFPRYTRADIDKLTKNGKIPTLQTSTLERVSATTTEDAAVGYYAIKNLPAIAGRMRDEPEQFGKHLNKLIETFHSVVEAEFGIMDEFSNPGASFAFQQEGDPRKAVRNVLIAALRMRYVLNKLNREWGGCLYEKAWQVGFGVDFGSTRFCEQQMEHGKLISLNGRPQQIARGIGQSAVSSQILISDTMYMQFPFLETAFDVGSPRHIPVKGEDHVAKARGVTGIVGPQSRTIYEIFV